MVLPFVFRKTWAVWISALPILYITMHWTDSLSNDPFLVYTFLNYSLLHYISFGLELLRGNARKEDNTAVKQYVRMLFYTFYQPYLFSLIVLYPDFERQIRERLVATDKLKPQEILSELLVPATGKTVFGQVSELHFGGS